MPTVLIPPYNCLAVRKLRRFWILKLMARRWTVRLLRSTGFRCRVFLSPAYDLLNTRLHVNDSDFALDGGLSPDIEKSDVYLSSQNPCRLDFERFGLHIGLPADVIKLVLDSYSAMPERVMMLVANSFLSAKMRRMYLRVVVERCKRFVRG